MTRAALNRTVEPGSTAREQPPAYPKTPDVGLCSQAEAKKSAHQKRGRSNRRKGARVENRLCHMLRELGCEAQRVPLSGAAGGKFSDDICITTPSGKVAFDAEVKARKDGKGFKVLEDWLGEADCLLLVRNNAPPLAVFPWAMLARIVSRL